MEVKALTYLILLMSSLGLEINLQNVHRFRQKIDNVSDGNDSETLESLILLWNSALKSAGAGSSDPAVWQRNTETRVAIPSNSGEPSSESLGKSGMTHPVESAGSEISLPPDLPETDDAPIGVDPEAQPVVSSDNVQTRTMPTTQAHTHAQSVASGIDSGSVQNGASIPNRESRPKTSGQDGAVLRESVAGPKANPASSPPMPAIFGDDQPPALTGRYLYGIGWGNPPRLQLNGLEDAPVYGIAYQDIVAIVHRCEPRPYQSENRDTAVLWVQRHQEVLDQAADLFQCIIPVGFDVIIDGTQATDADQVVQDWLTERYEQILAQMRRLTGKTEYGIKVFSTNEQMVTLARARNPEINKLEQKIATMSKGTAYLIRTQLSHLIRDTIDEIRGEIASNLKELLAAVVVEFKEENAITKQNEAELSDLIASLTVLLVTTDVEKVGAILEEFQQRFALTVEFTGPWPPYSFVENFD